MTTTLRDRAVAVVEVTAVFAVAHVLFRAIRLFTPWGRIEAEHGWNFTSGLVLAVCGLVAIALGGRSASSSGITVRGTVAGLRVGLAGIALVALAGALLTACGMPSTPAALGPISATILFVSGLLVTFALLGWLQRDERFHARFRPAVAWSILLGLLLLPLLVAGLRGHALPGVAAAVSWRFVCAGFGEEVFFRGYVQSRLNAAFGRRYRILGVRFGWGLVGAALLFGLVHVLNPFDYFRGHYELAWWHGLAMIATPYGFLREKTGTIVAPAIVHGLLDVLVLIPRL